MGDNEIYLLYREEPARPLDPDEDPWTIVRGGGEPVEWRILVAIEEREEQAIVFESRAEAVEWIERNAPSSAPVLDLILPDAEPEAFGGDEPIRILEHRIAELEAWRDSLDADGAAGPAEEDAAASLALDATALPTESGLYLYADANCTGTRRFRVTRYYGDLETSVRTAQNWWPPRSAYSVGGFSAMWLIKWPKATGTTARETVQSGSKRYNTMPFIPLAAEFIVP